MKRINKKIMYCTLLLIITVLVVCMIVFRDRKMICTLKINQDNYTIDTTYTIFYKKDIVQNVKIDETVSSSDSSVLDQFESDWEEQYKYNQDTYGGYTYKINKKKGKVVSNVKVDYQEMNMKRFLRINNAMKEYVNENNQVTISGIQKMYVQSGAICK
jgi:hypothetical protein